MKIKRRHGEANLEKVPGMGWVLLSILVEEEFRGQGIGSSLMTEILKKCGRPIYLFASSELGGDVDRLKRFYRRFGFVPAKGRRDDLMPYNYNMVLE